MSAKSDSSLKRINTLSERFVTHVKHRFDLKLDYSENTLSVLDHFVRAVVMEESGSSKLPPGHGKRTQLIHLLAPTMGAYFGEVLCRAFACHWSFESEDPIGWLIKFDHVPLWLNPAGAAAEALMEQSIESWKGGVTTSPEETEALKERLAAAPPVAEDEFFCVATRFEVLQIAHEWLQARASIADE
jgi:hypothetical protein